jgi:hypothetical protein
MSLPKNLRPRLTEALTFRLICRTVAVPSTTLVGSYVSAFGFSLCSRGLFERLRTSGADVK